MSIGIVVHKPYFVDKVSETPKMKQKPWMSMTVQSHCIQGYLLRKRDKKFVNYLAKLRPFVSCKIWDRCKGHWTLLGSRPTMCMIHGHSYKLYKIFKNNSIIALFELTQPATLNHCKVVWESFENVKQLLLLLTIWEKTFFKAIISLSHNSGWLLPQCASNASSETNDVVMTNWSKEEKYFLPLRRKG